MHRRKCDVIIATGALVKKDVPSNSVAGGPARVLSSLDDYLEKRRMFIIEHPANIGSNSEAKWR